MAIVRTVLIAAVVTMAILTTSLVAVYAMFTVDVPSVRDKPVAEAKAVLESVGLTLFQVSAAGSVGLVRDQTPAPGHRAFVSSVVIVSVGHGGDLPDGEEPTAPEEEQAGPPPGAPTSPGAPSTSPGAPSTTAAAAAQREVTTKVKVPKVVGKTPEEARVALTRAGVALGEIKQGVSEDFKFGVVFSQKPKAGMLVEPGAEVTIMVNREDETAAEDETP